jgi:hypothetical protein
MFFGHFAVAPPKDSAAAGEVIKWARADASASSKELNLLPFSSHSTLYCITPTALAKAQAAAAASKNKSIQRSAPKHESYSHVHPYIYTYIKLSSFILCWRHHCSIIRRFAVQYC